MTSENWEWWVGHEDELAYHTSCDTREEAVRIASEDQDGGYICEAIQPAVHLKDYFRADRFLDNAEDDAWDDHGNPEGDNNMFEVTPDQEKALETKVRAAIAEWQAEQGLHFVGFKFSAQRNEEYIPEADHD
jgi:hypothetical protein